MRLINCKTLQLEEFYTAQAPAYAILSHTWGAEEISYAEFNSITASPYSKTEAANFTLRQYEFKEGYKKIKFACTQALKDGLDYVWVDTCCIDKSSSSELTESINSMFRWYEMSVVCYAFLSDVAFENFEIEYAQSRWFRRGWTLQELIAPRQVMFFDNEFRALGDKSQYVGAISEITGIDESALTRLDEPWYRLQTYCVARRMSWAANRETTRLEDIAYSLLGIFDVNMPLLYGEGHRAFTRLQEEIIRRSDDESILAWGLNTKADDPIDATGRLPKNMMSGFESLVTGAPILAPSPSYFRDCGQLQHGSKAMHPFTLTNAGLQIELNLVAIPVSPTGFITHGIGRWIGLLNCASESNSDLVGILLIESMSGIESRLRRVPFVQRSGQFDDIHTKATALIGERLASQAVRTKLTVASEDDESLYKRNVNILKYFINETRALRNLGFSATTLLRLDGLRSEGFHDDMQWNVKTKVLTATKLFSDVLLGFVFESSTQLPSFAAIVSKSNAIVRKTADLDSMQIRNEHDFRQILSQEDESKDVVFTTADNDYFKITVTATEKRICHWRVIDVEVDAVSCEAGLNSRPVPSDRWKQAVTYIKRALLITK